MEHLLQDWNQVSTSGRPVFEDEFETQLIVSDDSSVTIKSPLGAETTMIARSAIVTNLNIWFCISSAKAKKLSLAQVLRVEFRRGKFFQKQHSIEIFLSKDPSKPLIKICFGGNAEKLYKGILKSLERKSWLKKKKVIVREQGFNTQFAGVGGILRRQEQARKQADTLTNEAFNDLSSLIDAASEIVALSERYSAQLRKHKESDAEEENFFNILSDMGIANPATKKACGSRFHEELARELCDFLSIHLEKHAPSGFIALTDLYCLVNRARGTQLVSPNDLYQACELMDHLKLPYTLKRFTSGVLALQTHKQNDDVVAKEFLRLLETTEYVTAQSIARVQIKSIPIAQAQLIQTENMGLICRDETAEDLRFYKNRFAEVI